MIFLLNLLRLRVNHTMIQNVLFGNWGIHKHSAHCKSIRILTALSAFCPFPLSRINIRYILLAVFLFPLLPHNNCENKNQTKYTKNNYTLFHPFPIDWKRAGNSPAPFDFGLFKIIHRCIHESTRVFPLCKPNRA